MSLLSDTTFSSVVLLGAALATVEVSKPLVHEESLGDMSRNTGSKHVRSCLLGHRRDVIWPSLQEGREGGKAFGSESTESYQHSLKDGVELL